MTQGLFFILTSLTVDQYMASVDKQMLGTETARALRSKGVTSVICGLSANDLESTFRANGADCFLLKPIPCAKDELEQVFVELVNIRDTREAA